MLPTPLADVLLPLAPAFTAPTFDRFARLALAALLTTGRRTVANLLRTLRRLAPGHRTSYQRVLSRARWSGPRLACALWRQGKLGEGRDGTTFALPPRVFSPRLAAGAWV
jgi:hypothetical protein